MSKQCKKCGNHIPNRITIKGVIKNLYSRKYCFDCSPYGDHNTRVLERVKESKNNGITIKTCTKCDREHNGHTNLCAVCYFRRRKKQVSRKVANIVGQSCWICGYNKTKRSLCFHHINPKNKKFCLSTRELMLKWSLVWKELQKCIFVCLNCHGEIHSEIIDPDRVKQIWENRWSEISGDSLAAKTPDS